MRSYLKLNIDNKLQSEKGCAMLEFTLVMPFFFFVIVSTVSVSQIIKEYFLINEALKNAAATGYAVSLTYQTTCTKIEEYIEDVTELYLKNSGANASGWWSSPEVKINKQTWDSFQGYFLEINIEGQATASDCKFCLDALINQIPLKTRYSIKLASSCKV